MGIQQIIKKEDFAEVMRDGGKLDKIVGDIFEGKESKEMTRQEFIQHIGVFLNTFSKEIAKKMHEEIKELKNGN